MDYDMPYVALLQRSRQLVFQQCIRKSSLIIITLCKAFNLSIINIVISARHDSYRFCGDHKNTGYPGVSKRATAMS